MRTKILLTPLLATLAFSGCRKEQMQSDCGNKDAAVTQSPAVASREPVTPISGSSLLGHLPTLNNIVYDEVIKTNADQTVTEGSRIYHVNTNNEEYVSMSIGDFANAEDLIARFFIGKGIAMQSPASADAGLVADLDDGKSQLMIRSSVQQGVINFANGTGVWDPDGLLESRARPRLIVLSAGSHFVSYGNTNQPDVKGWDLYDASGKTAMMILVVKSRYCLLLEHTGANNSDYIKSLAENINISTLQD